MGDGRTLRGYVQGQRAVSVEFILDYLNIGFDEYKLFLFNWPIVILGGRTIKKTDLEYRDSICFIIGSSVVEAEDVSSNYFSINFDCDVSLRVSLSQADREAPDVAILYDKRLTELMAW